MESLSFGAVVAAAGAASVPSTAGGNAIVPVISAEDAAPAETNALPAAETNAPPAAETFETNDEVSTRAGPATAELAHQSRMEEAQARRQRKKDEKINNRRAQTEMAETIDMPPKEDALMDDVNRRKRDIAEAQEPSEHAPKVDPLPWNKNAGAPLVASSLQAAAAAGAKSTETIDQPPTESTSTEMMEFGTGKKKAKSEEHSVLMQGDPDVWANADDDNSL